MSQLITTAHRIIPGGEPHLNSFGDRARITQPVSSPKTGQHDQQSQKHCRQPIAGNGIQHQQSTGHDQRWTEVSLQEEKEQRESGTDENRQDVAQRREGNAPQDKWESIVLFLEFAQQFPSVSKVTSQKEHQENLNDF